jgi:tRNA (guanine-N(7)-)-methyltransferase
LYLSYPFLSEILPPSSEVHLEIGFGKGEFLIELARRFPDLYWIGVEKEGEVYFSALRRAQKEGLKNLLLFYLDARLFLSKLVPPCFFSEVWLNFPDPWPKKRHRERRLSSPEFIEPLLNRVRMGGGIHLLTDSRELQQEMAESLLHQRVTPLRKGDPWSRDSLGIKTRYQRKWEDLERSLFLLEVRKSGHPGREFPLPERVLEDEFPACGFPPPGQWEREGLILRVFPGFRHDPDLSHFLFIHRREGFSISGWLNRRERWCLFYGLWEREMVFLWRSALL